MKSENDMLDALRYSMGGCPHPNLCCYDPNCSCVFCYPQEPKSEVSQSNHRVECYCGCQWTPANYKSEIYINSTASELAADLQVKLNKVLNDSVFISWVGSGATAITALTGDVTATEVKESMCTLASLPDEELIVRLSDAWEAQINALARLFRTPIIPEPKCDCGAHSVNSTRHSTWCSTTSLNKESV